MELNKHSTENNNFFLSAQNPGWSWCRTRRWRPGQRRRRLALPANVNTCDFSEKHREILHIHPRSIPWRLRAGTLRGTGKTLFSGSFIFQVNWRRLAENRVGHITFRYFKN